MMWLNCLPVYKLDHRSACVSCFVTLSRSNFPGFLELSTMLLKQIQMMAKPIKKRIKVVITDVAYPLRPAKRRKPSPLLY